MPVSKLDIVEPAAILPGGYRIAKSRKAAVFKNECVDVWTSEVIPSAF